LRPDARKSNAQGRNGTKKQNAHKTEAILKKEEKKKQQKKKSGPRTSKKEKASEEKEPGR